MNGIPFRYYVNGKDTIPVFLFLEYDYENGLRSFCDKKKTLHDTSENRAGWQNLATKNIVAIIDS